MPMKIRVGSALLGEYVALGLGNKVSIINAYSGDVIVERLPADLAFGIYLELDFGTDGAPDNLRIEAVLDGKKVVEGRAGAASGSGGMGTIAIPQLPFHIERDCNLELYVSAEGYARTRALRKAIKQGVIPSA